MTRTPSLLLRRRTVCGLAAWGLGTCLGLGLTWAAPPLRPYDAQLDANAALQAAANDAAASRQRVLVVFGANWCPDCLALDQALRQPDTANWVQQRFKVVKVDVGNFNRNQALNERLGDPIRMGIPAAVILDDQQHVLYATRGGELSQAQRMGPDGVARFLLKVLGELR